MTALKSHSMHSWASSIPLISTLLIKLFSVFVLWSNIKSLFSLESVRGNWLVKKYKIGYPFSYFKDNDIQRKWCQTFEIKNISQNKKVLLEPKDVVQGSDWELIFRIKILRSNTYLGREIVSEELIFDLGLGEDLKHQSNIGNDR